MGIGRTAALVGVFALAGAAASFGQLQPCPVDAPCVEITVGSPSEPTFPGGIVRIPINVAPADDDGATGGLDQIAAISLSVATAGLELADCSAADENGLNPSFVVPARIIDQFVVSVENTSCGKRDRCLCPDSGQERDAFINVAIFPAPDQTAIPTLAAGELLSIWLRVADETTADVRAHVFAETDDPKTTPKPTFAGYVTLGDNQAVDVTADRKSNVSHVRVTDGTIVVSTEITPTAVPTLSPTAPPGGTESPTPDRDATETPTGGPTPSSSPNPCAGDCGQDGRVSIDELIRAVAVALGRTGLDGCSAADLDADGVLQIDELVRAVVASLSGCAG